MAVQVPDAFDFVVVGSGAGGGTLGARLAEEGYTVLVLEAGGDPMAMAGGNAVYPQANRTQVDYQVPVFHALSCENTAMQWEYWVRHYADDAQQHRNPKYRAEWNGKPVDGVLYPRAGCLGGCTAHNAMILVYPHNADWDQIAALTGDPSWSAPNMRSIFESIEDCRHRLPWYRWLGKLGINPTGHGWGGWLRTEVSIPKEALEDKMLVATLAESVESEFKAQGDPLRRSFWQWEAQGDPNDSRLVQDNAYGIRYTPLLNHRGARLGTRDRLLDVQKRFPERLFIELDALASKVVFDDQNNAVGVEYLKGARLYQAHVAPSTERGQTRVARARREVILCGGAFNTPQLLMLSGIGPAAELARHGIASRVDSPGVGSNLQDRYEVGVVNRMSMANWKVLEGAKYAPGDPQHTEWQTKREGVYATNGAVLAVIRRSSAVQPLPDLFCFALLGRFEGYFPGFSIDIATKPNYLTWAVLKAHTNNTAGSVTLKSADPTERPHINFRYFEEGNDTASADLQAVVDGVNFVRRLTKPLHEDGLIAAEEVPGPAVQTDKQIADFIRNEAWGHHASCTCPIGADTDPMAVLDSKFRVRGVQRLRVVDASVFPRIPGFFIVSAVYLVAEKAAREILVQTRGH